MKRRVGLATLMLALLVPQARAQSGHDLFQQALVSERSDAELQQAIALYRRIADEYAADRQLAARALLRLGGVYETLGSAEAATTYERLVRDFAEQETEVAEAQARLAALRAPVAPMPQALPTRRLILDLLPEGAPIIDAKPTPDGRHLMRYDWERRAFQLTAIASSGPTHLPPQRPDTTRLWQPGHAYSDKLSPDGRLIASLPEVPAPGDSAAARDDTGRVELRVFDIGDPGDGRTLSGWDADEYYRLSVFGWSLDQARVWVSGVRFAGTAEIAWVETRDGSFEVLKTLPWGANAPSLSRDGRFIAFHGSDTRNAPPDVFLLATDGSREVRVEHPARDSKPIFAPDGSGIVFDSNRRDGIRDLWFLPVVDGRPAGDPRIVFEDIFPFNGPLEFGDNGSLYYHVGMNGWEIYAADIDVVAGTVGVPERIEPRHGEMNTAPAYSPDGRFLAHLRNGRRLVLRELSTGAEREFPIPTSSMILGSLDWCPGGDAMIVTGYQSEFFVVRVDLEHGGAKRLPLADPMRAVCVGTGDVVYTRPESRTQRRTERPMQVVRHSPATGAESLLAAGDFGTTLIRSPDGKSIAFFRNSVIESQKHKDLLVMSSSGGEAVSVASFPLFTGVARGSNFHGLIWLPDGDALLVALGPDRAPNVEEKSPELTFRRVPLDGDPVSVVGRMRLPAFARAYFGSGHYSLHPNSSRIVFTRNTGLAEEIWAIDNLLQFIQSGQSLPIASPVRR